jgi:hypothetical protein
MPAELLAVERDRLVATLVTVIGAFGIIAPLGSVTSPVIDPSVWGYTTTAAEENKTNNNVFLILGPPQNVPDATDAPAMNSWLQEIIKIPGR